MAGTDPAGWIGSACSFDVSDVRTITIAWSSERFSPTSSSLMRTSLSATPFTMRPSSHSVSQRWQQPTLNSHFRDKSRSSHSQLSIDWLGRWSQESNFVRQTCLFFPALQRSFRYLMMIDESFIAASPGRALMTVLRVLGDMHASSCVALYSSLLDAGW
jgi:hypothetical protein